MDDPQRPSHSASSSLSLTSTLLEDQDESVRIAVRALDDMRNNAHANGKSSSITTPALSVTSLSSVDSPSLASPALSTHETPLSQSPSSEPVFFRRVSHLPLVNGAISMYEHGKASSRVVKYGAEMVESGVKTISRPVIDRLPINTVEHLDEFACRQLDKLDKYRPSFGSPTSPHSATPTSAGRDLGQERERSRDTDGEKSAESLPLPLHHQIPPASSSRSGRATSSASLGDPNSVGLDSEMDPRLVRRDSRDGDRDVLMRRVSEHGERAGEWGRHAVNETKVGSWLEVTSPHFPRGRTREAGETSGGRDSRSSTPTPSAGGRTRGRSFGYTEYSYSDISDNYLRRRRSSLHEGDKDLLPDTSSSDLRNEKSRRSSLVAASSSSSDHRTAQQVNHSQNQIAPRSAFQNVLLGVGGFGFAWSEDSMRKLRYCLSWLQYATAHIDAQILVLRDFTASLQQQYPVNPAIPTNSSGASRSRTRHERRASENMTISADHQNRLIDIRRDVVQTVRDVVKVISTYGGGATLPESAKNAVKGFILRLPRNWSARAADGVGGDSSAVAHGPGSGRESLTTAAAGGHAGRGHHPYTRPKDRGVGGSSKTTSPHSSRPASPSASRVLLRDGHSEDAAGAGQTMSAGTAVVAAQKILVLATESLDMMRGVTGVVKESLDSADAWVERLRQVGLHRAETQAAGPSEGQPGGMHPPVAPGEECRGDRQDTMRDHRDSDLLSPLSISRRGSVSSSAGSVYDYASPGRSSAVSPAPSSSSYASYGVAGYRSKGAPVDTPSPDMGRVMRKMTLGDEEDIAVKKEDDDERAGRMDVDS